MTTTPTPSPELLPCPFCGNAPKLFNREGEQMLGGAYIACKFCGVSTSIDTTARAAVGAWNTRAALATSAAGEPVAPDVLEKLTYHQHERDDMTLDEVLEYLARGWTKVHGRSERQLILQLCALLAAAPAPTQPAEPFAVPPGWKLVPVEPTPSMIEAVDRIRHGRVLSHTMIYAAISAAPPAPAPERAERATGKQSLQVAAERVPLTENEIGSVVLGVSILPPANILRIARAIERAHGITGAEA